MKILATFCLFFGLALDVGAAGSLKTYSIGDNLFEGYYVPRGREAPLVLLFHDWDGLTGYEIERAEMIAAKGYTVFAVDLFGKGVRPETVEERRRITESLYDDRPRLRVLMQGGMAAAGELGANVGNAVAAGYCFGGAAVLELARSGGGLKGFVTFHGGLETPAGQNYTQTEGSVLVFHGTADASVSMNDFAALAVDLETAGIPHEMVTYGGAPHAFTVFGSKRYRKEADEKSWRRFLEYLRATLD